MEQVEVRYLDGPIALFTFKGNITLDTFEEYERKFKQVYTDLPGRFGLLFDCSEMEVNLLNIIPVAKRQTALLKEMEPLSARQVVASSIVITNSIVRNLIDFMIKMRKSIAPQIVLEDKREAYTWLHNQIHAFDHLLIDTNIREEEHKNDGYQHDETDVIVSDDIPIEKQILIVFLSLIITDLKGTKEGEHDLIMYGTRM